MVNGLTWSEHDFFDSIKDDALWAKAKETVIKQPAALHSVFFLSGLKLRQ